MKISFCILLISTSLCPIAKSQTTIKQTAKNNGVFEKEMIRGQYGGNTPDSDKNMLVRISEIEIYPQYIDEYLSLALEVGAASVREEPGVIAIYPMIQQRDSCQVRILEIYAHQEAYNHHIGTKHFKTYKQGTLHMVKSLDLVDMTPMNPVAMPEIFLKMKNKK